MRRKRTRPIRLWERETCREIRLISILNTNSNRGVRMRTCNIDWKTWRNPFKKDRPMACKNEQDMWNKSKNGEEERKVTVYK